MTPEPASGTCDRCGTAADVRPFTWSLLREPGVADPRWLCDACTREHVHAIEGRLDDAWWGNRIS